MERLVTTSQAAEILGLSLQGIHYRIKKDQLKSIKKDGKTFVNGSEILASIVTANGMIHVINDVLLPPATK